MDETLPQKALRVWRGMGLDPRLIHFLFTMLDPESNASLISDEDIWKETVRCIIWLSVGIHWVLFWRKSHPRATRK